MCKGLRMRDSTEYLRKSKRGKERNKRVLSLDLIYGNEGVTSSDLYHNCHCFTSVPGSAESKL